MKSKIIWYEIECFPGKFGFCPDKETWYAEMKRFKIEGEPYPTSYGRVTTFTEDNNVISIVTINEAADKEDDLATVVGVLVHEAVHVFQRLCEHIGEKSPSSELEAYGIEYIACKLLKSYIESGRSKIMKGDAS